jgi:hypothetical protein
MRRARIRPKGMSRPLEAAPSGSSNSTQSRLSAPIMSARLPGDKGLAVLAVVPGPVFAETLADCAR